MADQRGSFEDHDAILTAIKRIRVAELKLILRDFNETQRDVAKHSLTGLKQVLQERVVEHISILKNRNNLDRYLAAKGIIEKHYGSRISAAGQRTAVRRNPYPAFQAGPAQALGGVPGYAHTDYNGAQYAHRAGPYAYGMAGQPMGMPPPQLRWPNFRPSPFYKVKEWVAQQEITPRLRDPDAKLQTTLRVLLNPTQLAEIQKPSINLRLFCAPSLAFNTSANPAHPTVVEFPIHTDVKVNDGILSVNFRGKKTAAKVLPPDLNKDRRLMLRQGSVERIDLLCQKIDRAYIMAAAICESHSAESLAENVSKNKVKSKNDVLRDMQKAAEDDDIEIGDADISLKCPLSYMRLQMPARSTVCSHTQCFDVLSFFSINEQTPSWQCPTCQKSIDPETLFLDGYMLDILKRVPESVDVVTIDNQGRWRTADGKYKSDDTASAATPMMSPKQNGQHKETSSPTKSTGEARVKGEDESASFSREASVRAGSSRAQKQIEVLDLDDGDETDEASEAPLAGPSNGSSAAQANGLASHTSPPGAPTSNSSAAYYSAHDSSGTRAHPVIDLTLSDSEEEEAPPPPRSAAPRLLAPLPPAAPRRALSTTVQRPTNGSSSRVWGHIDNLDAANRNSQPIYGGTFGGGGSSSSSASGQQTLMDSWRERNGATSANATPAQSSSSPAGGSSPNLQSAAPTGHASPPLANRLGQQVADPYEYVQQAGTSAAEEQTPQGLPTHNEAHDAGVGDESVPIARARKRPRRNSVLLGHESDGSSPEGNGEAAQEAQADYMDELQGIDYDDFDLELEAEAGLADSGNHEGVVQPPSSTVGHASSLADRLDGEPNSAASASNGHSRHDSTSSDGLQEDERAGLS